MFIHTNTHNIYLHLPQRLPSILKHNNAHIPEVLIFEMSIEVDINTMRVGVNIQT